jgi:hypothetical protein
MPTMQYPTLAAVNATESYDRICLWYRYLPTPTTQDETDALAEVTTRFNAGGGISVELQREIKKNRFPFDAVRT